MCRVWYPVSLLNDLLPSLFGSSCMTHMFKLVGSFSPESTLRRLVSDSRDYELGQTSSLSMAEHFRKEESLIAL